MIVQDTGGASVRVLDVGNGVLAQALDAARATPTESLDSAFGTVLAWLRDRIAAGELLADDPLRGLLLAVTAPSPDPAAIAAGILSNLEFGQRLLNRLQDLQDEVPFLFGINASGIPQLRTLAELVGDTPVRLDSDWSTGNQSPPDTPVFTLRAGAQLGIGMEVLDGTQLAQRYGAEVAPATDVGLVVQAGGKVHADLKLAHGVGSLGFGASADQLLALVYEFSPKETTLASLLSIPGSLPSTLSLAAVGAALRLPGHDGLHQITLQGESAVDFVVSTSRKTSNLNVRAVTVDGKRYSIERRRSSSRSLSLIYNDRAVRQRRIFRNERGDLVLQLKRLRERSSTGSVAVSGGLKVTGWGAIAADLVAATLPDATDAIGLLEEFTDPRKLIANHLRDRLPAALAPIAPVVVGDLTGSEAGLALNELIEDWLLSRFDLWTAAAIQDTTGLVDDLMAELDGTRHGLEVASRLRSWLAAKLDDLASDARANLVARLERVTGPAAEALRKALEPAGIIVDAAAEGAALLEPVLRFLRRYGAWRRKLVDAATEKLNFDVSISFAYERERKETSTLEYDLTVPAAAWTGSQAEEDFSRWLRGRAFREPARPFGVPLETMAEHWKAASTRYSAIGETITLDLGFTSVSTRTLLQTDTTIEIGPAGVLLARTTAKATKSYRWGPDKVRAMGQAIFDGLSGSRPLSTFDLEFEFTEQALERAELDAILASLRHVPALFSSEDAAALVQAWEELFRKEARAPAAALRFGMALDARHRASLRTAAQDEPQRRLAIARALVIAGEGRRTRNLGAALPLFGWDGDPAWRFVSHWDDIRRAMPRGLIKDITLNGHDITFSMRSSPLYAAATQLQQCMNAASAMDEVLRAVATWKDVTTVVAEVLPQVTTSPGYDRKSDAAKAELLASAVSGAYDDMALGFAADFGRALSSNDVEFDSKDDVPVFTLFVMVLLASLTGARLVGSLRKSS